MSLLGKKLRRKKQELPHCSMVVAAAGSSRRMDGTDKLLMNLGDIPVLVRTLRALEGCPLVDEIVVVTRDDLLVPVSQLCREFKLSKVTKVVTGGSTRTASVLAGVREVWADAALIGVHDGARPFVTGEVIEAVILKAGETGAAAPAIPISDTVKRARDGVVEETLERSVLYAVQTPQVFEGSLLRAALKKAVDDGVPITDDCSAVERLGMPVALTEGSSENMKLTTPEDLNLGLGILNGRGEPV